MALHKETTAVSNKWTVSNPYKESSYWRGFQGFSTMGSIGSDLLSDPASLSPAFDVTGIGFFISMICLFNYLSIDQVIPH